MTMVEVSDAGWDGNTLSFYLFIFFLIFQSLWRFLRQAGTAALTSGVCKVVNFINLNLDFQILKFSFQVDS